MTPIILLGFGRKKFLLQMDIPQWKQNPGAGSREKAGARLVRGSKNQKFAQIYKRSKGMRSFVWKYLRAEKKALNVWRVAAEERRKKKNLSWGCGGRTRNLKIFNGRGLNCCGRDVNEAPKIRFSPFPCGGVGERAGNLLAGRTLLSFLQLKQILGW